MPDKAIYTPLRKLSVDGKIKAGTMVVHRAPITDLQLTVKGQEGSFRIAPFSLKAYQGAISGNAEVRVKGNTPATRLDMRINGLQIGPLLRDQLQKDILEGTTQATIQLNMTGDQPDRIKQSLGGKGELLVTNGAIVGIDLANMVRNVQAAFGLAQPTSGEKPRTDFTELRIPYVINKGVVTTPDIRLQSPFLRLQAAGSADLVRESLDFRIEPKFVGTIKGQGDTATHKGITVPVLVGGSFDRPTFKPDLKSIARQQLEREAVQKVFEKKELKPYKETIKGLLDSILSE
ncbi:AsmA family protein [Desulfosarcina cetonica]|uniref:AsmA family protein n=1 Tax=Desulfosarcina cetonica TaxID=90730 RepID=UPI00278BFD31|nr:AsmA-like C-terminal region-containing protein [Desulfosarcina cetonica]